MHSGEPPVDHNLAAVAGDAVARRGTRSHASKDASPLRNRSAGLETINQPFFRTSTSIVDSLGHAWVGNFGGDGLVRVPRDG